MRRVGDVAAGCRQDGGVDAVSRVRRGDSGVHDILDGHVGLDLECFDQIYLNGQVPTLQVPGRWSAS